MNNQLKNPHIKTVSEAIQRFEDSLTPLIEQASSETKEQALSILEEANANGTIKKNKVRRQINASIHRIILGAPEPRINVNKHPNEAFLFGDDPFIFHNPVTAIQNSLVNTDPRAFSGIGAM